MEWGGLPSEFSVIQSAFGKDVFMETKGRRRERKGMGRILQGKEIRSQANSHDLSEKLRKNRASSLA